MIVRRAIPGDVPNIRALEVELFGGEAWSHTAIEPELAGEDRVALVAVDRGSLVGYVALRITGHDADLNRIAVNPLYQRRGIASRLLAAALESARTSEVTRLLLEVAEHNEAAAAFYRREGFVEIARRQAYYRDGAAAIVMERRCAGRG